MSWSLLRGAKVIYLFTQFNLCGCREQTAEGHSGLVGGYEKLITACNLLSVPEITCSNGSPNYLFV